MVSEIEFGIKREGEQSQRGDDFGKFFSQQAGPGGCKNEQECFAYCNDSAHGAECISFGTKHEVFQGGEAVERYQKYNDFGGQGQGQGPSPECFAAIQSGDFAKAKEICSAPSNPYQYQPPQYQQQRPPEQMINYQQSSAPARIICPVRPEFDCQFGYQKIYKTTPDGCGISECVYDGGNSHSSYGSANSSSYSYSSYNYTPPTGQREQIWNSYGLRSWIRTDADSARMENLKQVCASVTSAGGNIWTPDAGNSQSVDFGMPDEAKCRAWTPSSSSSSIRTVHIQSCPSRLLPVRILTALIQLILPAPTK